MGRLDKYIGVKKPTPMSQVVKEVLYDPFIENYIQAANGQAEIVEIDCGPYLSDVMFQYALMLLEDDVLVASWCKFVLEENYEAIPPYQKEIERRGFKINLH